MLVTDAGEAAGAVAGRPAAAVSPGEAMPEKRPKVGWDKPIAERLL